MRDDSLAKKHPLAPADCAGHLAPARSQFNGACELAAAGIDRKPWNRRQIRPRDQHDVGTVGRERAARHGSGDHARQIQHAQPRQRTVAGAPRLWRGVADFLDRQQRQFGKRFGMRQSRPFIVRAHHRHHRAAGIGGRLERLGIPQHQRGLDLIALRLAIQHLADGVAVMREIGVQPHEALIAGPVDAGNRIPGRPRRLGRRGADTARCGIRRGRASCRRRHSAIGLYAVSRSRPPRARPRRCWLGLQHRHETSKRSCGSAPVSVTLSSAATSPPAAVQMSARISRGALHDACSCLNLRSLFGSD